MPVRTPTGELRAEPRDCRGLPVTVGSSVTGGYGNGQDGTITYMVWERALVRWSDGDSTWQACSLLRRQDRT
jgi:hypothetical protein